MEIGLRSAKTTALNAIRASGKYTPSQVDVDAIAMAMLDGCTEEQFWVIVEQNKLTTH